MTDKPVIRYSDVMQPRLGEPAWVYLSTELGYTQTGLVTVVDPNHRKLYPYFHTADAIYQPAAPLRLPYRGSWQQRVA